MDSTVAVHTNGLGSSFQAFRKASMDAFRSSTLRKTPRRMAFVIQMAEPSLDKIHPARAGGDEVRHESGIALQPGLHFRVLVGSVVVHDQMQRDIAGELGVDAAQEFQKLLMAMSLMAFADDLAL